jgi:Zn-dependent protease
MRLRIGSGFGIPVYLHWTFFLLPLWIVWSHPGESEAGMPLPFLFTVVGLSFFCVVLHEFGHALMARHFGIGTRDVTLYPIGGVARLMKMTDKPLEEILIAIAGPAVNVAIAIVLAMGLLALAMINPEFSLESFAGKLLMSLMIINGIILVGFNLLPAFPMDGGRVLRALLALGMGNYRATQLAVRIGTVVAILMSIAGIISTNYMLALIGLFVIFVGQQELFVASMRERQRRRWQDEEPLTVLPAPPRPHPVPTFAFRPANSVYTWDNQSGTWRKEPGTLT